MVAIVLVADDLTRNGKVTVQKLIATQFRVQNYKCFSDSGWIKIDHVTAIVGCNESGKSALLMALYKFNPVDGESYESDDEYPRARLMSTPDSGDINSAPVCSVEFALSDSFREYIESELFPDLTLPESIIVTRHYSGLVDVEYFPKYVDDDEVPDSLRDLFVNSLPIFLHFDEYPQMREMIELAPQLNNPVQAIEEMLRCAGLDIGRIHELGSVVEPGQRQRNKVLRSSLLQKASVTISAGLNALYRQRQHVVHFEADDTDLRIAVSDTRHLGWNITWTNLSKGFQWFVSFFLLFSNRESSQDAILLLDEPGLHLHLSAQAELLKLFDQLAEDRLIIYTTHSPGMIDREHLDGVRILSTDDEGYATLSEDGWVEDSKAIFPVQLAAGPSMIIEGFRHKGLLLIEGYSDYLYLTALNRECGGLADDTIMLWCDGAQGAGMLAPLFLRYEIRPAILLDGDAKGQSVQQKIRAKPLYREHQEDVLTLKDVFGSNDYTIEDLVGEDAIDSAFSKMGLTLDWRGRKGDAGLAKSLKNFDLDPQWKIAAAETIVKQWKVSGVPEDIQQRAKQLFDALRSPVGRSRMWDDARS